MFDFVTPHNSGPLLEWLQERVAAAAFQARRLALREDAQKLFTAESATKAPGLVKTLYVTLSPEQVEVCWRYAWPKGQDWQLHIAKGPCTVEIFTAVLEIFRDHSHVYRLLGIKPGERVRYPLRINLMLEPDSFMDFEIHGTDQEIRGHILLPQLDQFLDTVDHLKFSPRIEDIGDTNA